MVEEEGFRSAKEERIRAITKLYYSNPKVQEALLKFALDREVVPRYYEGFGKRPDSLMYKDDIMGLVRKGATSFHASEEIWGDVLKIDSEMSQEEFNSLRKGWDLLIDVDSPFLDCSKIATKLIIKALEQLGVKNYGVKFSGGKGFHIIVSSKAFPSEYQENKTSEMFPEWPRAICKYLMAYIRKDYNKEVGELLGSLEGVEKRTNLKKEDLIQTYCISCNRTAKKGEIIKLICSVCGLEAEKRDAKISKRKLRCLNNGCAGILEIGAKKEYYYCENCNDPENESLHLNSDKYPEMFEEVKGVSAEKIADLDLILVAPRHLFRMPYSLHEKTSLASVVLDKEEIDSFTPQKADPLKVVVKDYYPSNEEGEARNLLAAALDWAKTQKADSDRIEKKKYSGAYKEIEMRGVTEEDFPSPIKKLLLGLQDGKKRGLFVLLTFLKSCGFGEDYINKKIREWNEKNKKPLKDGYVKSQIDWHLRQKKKILPPNYSNDAFYRDIGILDSKPEVKNPLVDVARKLRRRSNKGEDF